MNKVLVEELKNSFKKIYGGDYEKLCFAPGRVNLIGEHTDYNGGHVFPCALSMGTYGTIKKRGDRNIRMYSVNFPGEGVIEVSLDELKPGRTTKWSQYPEGVFWTFMEKGYQLDFGADIVFAGDLPSGSGLSSSASIEVLTGLMIKEIYGFSDVTNVMLAQFGQYSENTYNGMQCGIMDQFSSAMGKESHAIFLDTDSLEYKLVPICMEKYMLVITNSNVKHSLVNSAYNDRRHECAEALCYLKTEPELENIKNLCDISEEQFEKYEKAIKNPIAAKRARHAVSEDARTKKAVAALEGSDITAFGKLMNASHASLRDDYEVSCAEIDFLAECAQNMEGVIGSRITGGGFGGCTVSIINKDNVDRYIDEIKEKYFDRFGMKADVYCAVPSEGAHIVEF